ncbi:transglutaminase family protein [Tellurirhabdus rosea]|uniref:transglutaminase family protein n=1 Tax=Tellurirhabdus rosea TaxID=2674997 RepID=UPI00224F7BF4|nr:transglutaminase family protein [Tellurirhabdus rosea]
MELHVRHRLRYDYSAPVFLEPHTLYLYPRTGPHQRLNDYQLRIEPEPSLVARNTDTEGNIQQMVYFKGECRSLTVEAEMKVQSEPFNSFDFVLFPFETEKMPFRYSANQQRTLAPYLERDSVTMKVEDFARQIANETRWHTVPFLTLLCSRIREGFTYEVREVGHAHDPEETLNSRRGSCRDYAVLYIACCRSLGIAARFVSGYLFGNPQQEHELHAWAEAYLPGAGWRGFDPTEGHVVINKHLPLAASYYHDKLAPLGGTFIGKSVRSTMETKVEMF